MGVNGTGWSTSDAGSIRPPDSSIPRVNEPLTEPVECAASDVAHNQPHTLLNHLLRLTNPAAPRPLAQKGRVCRGIFPQLSPQFFAAFHAPVFPGLPRRNDSSVARPVGRRPGLARARVGRAPMAVPGLPGRAPGGPRRRIGRQGGAGTPAAGSLRGATTRAEAGRTGPRAQTSRRAMPDSAAPAGVSGTARRRAGSTGPGSRIRPRATGAKPSGT